MVLIKTDNCRLKIRRNLLGWNLAASPNSGSTHTHTQI